MGRYIAFDRPTANELLRQTKRAPQLGHGDALKAALSSESPAMLLLESEQEGEVLTVEIHRPAAPAETKALPKAVAQKPAPRLLEPPLTMPARTPEPLPSHEVSQPAPEAPPVLRTPTVQAAQDTGAAPHVEPPPAIAPAEPTPAPAPQVSAADSEAVANEPQEEEAYGFLGLSSTPILSSEGDEPAPEATRKHKKWWRR